MKMPIIYYPIKVLFIDDDQDLLELYNNKYKINYNVKTLSDPIEALKILNTQHPLDIGIIDKNIDLNEIELTDNEGELIIKRLILNNMLPFIKKKSKYNQIGIIVADYRMPEINGIDLFKKIKDKTIKKILLTGEYDLSGAVDSLNNKIIDCYINKGEEDTMKSITSFLEAFQIEYFNDLTDKLIGDLVPEHLPFLSDEKFIKFFKNKIEEHKVREYYLLDKNGTFLMIDDQSQKFILVIHTNNSLDEFCDLYNFKQANSNLFDSIKVRNQIPFFGANIDPLNIKDTEWKNYMYKANSYSDFFWAVIELDDNSIL